MKLSYLTSIMCLAAATLPGILRAEAYPHGEPSPVSDTITVLDSEWKFRQVGMREWHRATVPGTVHTDLMANGLIADPYFGMNEREVQWIDKEDWDYETVFDLDGGIAGKDNIELMFDGLDTYCDVFLNGEHILYADNMFRGWTVPCGGIIREKGNVLTVKFHSPIRIGLKKYDSLPYIYPASNDEPQSWHGGLFGKGVSVFTRKAGYHYGWDWGPRLVTCGIWRPVKIRGWNGLKINDIFYRQDRVTSKKAEITAVAEIICDAPSDGTVISIDAAFIGADSGAAMEPSYRRVASIRQDLKAGLNTVEIPFSIKNPKLWWSNGLGEPDMYSFRINVSGESRVTEAGLRDIRLIREDDADGRCYRFELNGVPVFIKGANYIPCDMFLPRVSDEVYEKTVADAVSVGMNMLRVWGGGTYEDGRFYSLCDRNGILVWQDFMFACSLYPADDEFLKNVGAEAEYNIRRLRNHPCIALWCGNNECDSALYGWGWNNRYKKSHPDWAVLIEEQQERIYGEVLADKVAALDPGKSYVHGSPIADRAPVDPTRGDCHYWAVWNGGKSISEYEVHKSRFYSEWGFQSIPSMSTIRTFAPDSASQNLESDVFNWHQRGNNGTQWIMKAVREYYWEPRSFEDAVYLSQVVQAFAAKTAVGAHRRYKPYCWGTMIWQHNDCWPVASWSSRDWYGNWKALHYTLKRVYDDILVSTTVAADSTESNLANVSVSVVSDRLGKVSGKLETVFMDVWGNVLRKESAKISVPANSSGIYASYGNIPYGCIAYTTFSDGSRVYESIQPVPLVKDVVLPAAEIDAKTVKTADGFEVTLSSPCFASSVYLETDELGTNFSDNFFDLLPGKPKTVSIKTDMPEETFRKRLKIKHLQQTKYADAQEPGFDSSAFRISEELRNGNTAEVTVHSGKGGVCRIRTGIPEMMAIVTGADGHVPQWKALGNGIVELYMEKGETVTISRRLTSYPVNYDEAAVPKYVLPDPLVMENGRKVRSVKDWEKKRRPEIMDMLRREMYGYEPGRPEGLHFKVLEESADAFGGKATRRQVAVYFTEDESRPMVLLMYIPNGIEGPVPAFMGMNFRGNYATTTDPEVLMPTESQIEGYGDWYQPVGRGDWGRRWPYEYVLSKGYAVVTMFYGDADPDWNDGFHNGVHGLVDKGKKRGADSWGTISAWAWGLSRALDYLETDPDIDASRVAVLGHSRLGKTALWAGATDPRFAAVISNCSGCSGAAISRRKFGETVYIVNDAFPHWFCANYRKYSNNEDALPFDQHELVAMIAPRPVYVSSASNDNWADQNGEYLSLVGAAPVYNLYGIEGFTSTDKPEVEQPRRAGRMGNHMRDGDHDILLYDWEQFVEFADRFLK